MTTPACASLLRLEVGRLRALETRRRFEPVMYVGRLAGPQRSCPLPLGDPLLDAGTRTEVVIRLIDAQREPVSAACAWLARPGDPQLQDDDLAWLAATSRAFQISGARLEGFWTVTRTGWLDVRTGETRTWKRLRV